MHMKENSWLRPIICLLAIACLELQLPAHGRQIQVQDLHVYPGKHKGKMKLSFSTFGDFSNLADIVKKEGFLDVGLVCVKRGAFILYQSPKYQAIGPPKNIQIASGENNCFKPTGKIGSVQPLGPINQPKKDSVTFFLKPYFASLGKTTSVPVLKRFFISFGTFVKSLILIGRTSWTITTTMGSKFCLVPKGLKGETSPICLLPDFSQTIIKHRAMSIRSLKKGCANDAKKIPITFCHYWGKAGPIGEYKAKSSDNDDKNGLGGRTGFQPSCAAAAAETDQEFNETLKLFKAVITSQFDQSVLLEWPGFGRDRWKLEMLDNIFAIAKAAISDELITDSYINRIRELFLFTLEKAWMHNSSSSDSENTTTAAGGGGDQDIAADDNRLVMLTEYDYRGMLYQTEECLKQVSDFTAAVAMAKWETISAIEETDPFIIDEFKRKMDANIVIEMTWIIVNLVGGLCHRQFQYAHNYWALYIHIVNRLYIMPVAPFWNQKIPHLDVILGGNMDAQHRKLAMWASVTLYTSHGLAPFKRPESKHKDEETAKPPESESPPAPPADGGT